MHRLCAALVDFGAPATVIDAAVLLAADTVTYFGTPPYRIDLLGDIDGVDFTAVWKDAVRTSVVGEDVLVISRRHLELNKSSTGRPKDAEDVRHLTRRTARKKRRP